MILRQLIIHIPFQMKPGSMLFISVKYNMGNPGLVVFVFHPMLNNEAHTKINKLFEYLSHTYGEGVHNIFSEDHQYIFKDMK